MIVVGERTFVPLSHARKLVTPSKNLVLRTGEFVLQRTAERSFLVTSIVSCSSQAGSEVLSGLKMTLVAEASPPSVVEAVVATVLHPESRSENRHVADALLAQAQRDVKAGEWLWDFTLRNCFACPASNTVNTIILLCLNKALCNLVVICSVPHWSIQGCLNKLCGTLYL